MNVREATVADRETLLRFTRDIFEENWDRPWPPPEIGPQLFDGKLALLAEDDGEPIGYAFGDVGQPGFAHVNIVYVVPGRRQEGVTKALLGEFAARARAEGAEHLTLDVATGNDVGREVWRRLGFTEWARRLTVPVSRLEERAGAGASYASIYVQTDDRAEVEAALAKYLPRFGGSNPEVGQPANGWVPLRAELTDRERAARERLASELSNATAAVVVTLAVEDGAVVRYAIYERGSIVDEYQSVPEYFGSLPPGDVVALGSNPTVVSRLTGADPSRFRAVARTASSPDELPPVEELRARIAEAMGLE